MTAGLIPHLLIKRKKSSPAFNLALLTLTNIRSLFFPVHHQNLVYLNALIDILCILICAKNKLLTKFNDLFLFIAVAFLYHLGQRNPCYVVLILLGYAQILRNSIK